MSIIVSGLKVDNFFNFAELTDLAYATNGIDQMGCYDLVNWTNMGIRSPPVKATDEGSNISGSLIVGGIYKTKFEYLNINKGTSSGMSPASAEITCQSNGGIRITVPADGNIDSQVTHTRGYLTADGANIYRRDGGTTEVAKAYDGSSSITFDFTVEEAARVTIMGELNDAGTANLDVHTPPPTSPFLMNHQDRMWFFGTRIYSTGTVTMSADPTVVGSSAVFVQGMKNMYFMVDGDARLYLIDSITDEDNLELTESYAGTTGADKTYYIFGEDSYLYYSYIETNGVPRPESMPSTNWLPVNKDDGFRGTGLGKVKTTPIVAKENSLYMLAGDKPSNYRTILIDASVGAISHRSMANDENGNLIFCAKDGVYITNGREPAFDLSVDIKNVFTGEGSPPWSVNEARLKYSHGVFDLPRKRYILWVAEASSSKEDRALIYDFNKVDGQPIGWYWWNIEATCSAIIRDSDDKPWVYFGDENGFVYYLDPDATNDGAGSSSSETRRGTATGGSSTTLEHTGVTFNTTGDGLKACKIKILSGTGSGQERIIDSNTATVITVTVAWTTNPDNTSVYAIGYISAKRVSGWLDFGTLLDKILRRIKAAFKIQSTTYSAYVKHYTDFSDTQTGSTLYLNMAETKGYHSAGFAANRSKHHRYEIGREDCDTPIEIKELELEIGIFGKPEETAEARE